MLDGETPFVVADNISKDFSDVRVLKNISIRIHRGEIHAVVGENGAGKSTLMNIIAGVYRPTEGTISILGEAVNFRNPRDAIEKKIALIHQEPLIFSDLDVAENIFAGHTRKDYGLFIKWADIYERAKVLLDSLGVQLDPRQRMKNMSIADQQMVEIVSALSQNAELIIMDEPTAALTPGEVRNLFAIVRKLKGQGKSFVFISHRLDEVLEISDSITVLRDGQFVGTYPKVEVDKGILIRRMIGREMKDHIYREKTEKGAVLLEVRNLSSQGLFSGVSFSVRAGEIVGIAGLVGAGRSEVARAIFGIDTYDSGELYLYGKLESIANPTVSIQKGLCYVPEDRQAEGLFLPYGIALNMTYSVPGAISKKGWIDRRKEHVLCGEYQKTLDIKMRDGRQAVQELSGGNQQKVVLAKWLLPEPEILILDEPTRGIDVGAKEEVYRIINQLSMQGKAIVMISSELPEITSLSDRVIVMKEGVVTGVFEGTAINDIAIMEAATKKVWEECQV
jgi:rhamnose transport system ATP-binding protein